MKAKILEAIHDARLAHNSWKSYAHLIAKGVIDDDEFRKMTPLVSTECGFGKWYFKDGLILSNFDSYKEIDAPHEKIHEIYAEIYKLVHTKIKTGWFESRKGAEAKRDKKINNLLEKMDEYVVILLDALDKLEKNISDLTDAQLYNKTK